MRIMSGWMLGVIGILLMGLGILYIAVPGVEVIYRLRSLGVIMVGLGVMYIAYRLSDEGKLGK